MDIIYSMPGNRRRLFINVIHACPNACLFCVDFKGDAFYGFDLKKGRSATVREIVSSVSDYSGLSEVEEIYFCGIGEPLLCYDVVVEAAIQLRRLFARQIMIAVNTSGTFYDRTAKVDFAQYFDLIQISLNAENEEKYNAICRPKIDGAYNLLMRFLRDLSDFVARSKGATRVELTVVDTSETEFLPGEEQKANLVPVPDFDACRRIADSFGWPLKVKSLLRDCEHGDWVDFAERFRAANFVAA